jgi:hypothetical protein
MMAKDTRKRRNPLFICPITQEPMLEPVVASDGYTYEKNAITKWMSIKETSPITSNRFDSLTLFPNYVIMSRNKELLSQPTKRKRTARPTAAAATTTVTTNMKPPKKGYGNICQVYCKLYDHTPDEYKWTVKTFPEDPHLVQAGRIYYQQLAVWEEQLEKFMVANPDYVRKKPRKRTAVVVVAAAATSSLSSY